MTKISIIAEEFPAANDMGRDRFFRRAH